MRKLRFITVMAVMIAMLLSPSSLNTYAVVKNTPVKNTSSSVQKQTNVFMWEVTPKDKNGKKLYVLGSIHIGDKSNFPLDKRIEDSYGKSDVLVVEADTSKLTAAVANEYITKYGKYTGKDTLKTKISSKLYQKLCIELPKMGIEMGPNTEKLKPWMLSSMISNMRAMENGYNPALGIDSYFIDKAKGKKSIMELESAVFQLEMLSGLNDRLQEAFLKDSFYSKEYFKDTISKMYQYWKVGDVKNLELMTFPKEQMTKDMAELYEIINYKRNVGMEKKIEGYLKDTKRTYFVIAGAAHMLGSRGVIGLLKAKGYSVRQM